MNNIQVPAGYKHMLRRPSKRTDEYKPLIRKFIESRPNEVIEHKDFNLAPGTTTATNHIKKLMKQGYITRIRVRHGYKGKRFTYQWNAVPLPAEAAAVANGEVVARSLDLPDFPLPAEAIDKLEPLCIEWFDELKPSAEQMVGALLFRKYIKDKYKGVEGARREIINAHNDNRRSSDSVGLS